MQTLAETREESLLARIAEHPQLPTPPAVALQVLERASRPDCALAEIGDLICHDSALCARLLQTINSALFSLPRAVTSVPRAVTLLGLKPVRSLVLSLSLPALHRAPPGDAQTQAYWMSSVVGAIAARELALRLRRPDPEDDLVAGLLRDVGVVVLKRVCPADYSQVLASPAAELALGQCEVERRLLGVSHAEVGAHLLRRWRLPEEITEAIRYHHSPTRIAGTQGPAAERAWLLHFATLVAHLHLASAEEMVLSKLLGLAQDRYGMSAEQLREFLEPLSEKAQQFADLLNVEIGPLDRLGAVLIHATEELVRLTVETSVDHLRVCEARDRAEREASRWQRAADQMRVRAELDPLTGTHSRWFFEQMLQAEFRAARRRCTTLGVLFLDLDGFKALNDQYGHAFGDQMLREVAHTLRQEAGGDAVVTRYGGDEFCVLVPGASEPGLLALAERLRQTVAALTVRQGEQVGSVAASIGAVVGFPRHSDHSAWQFLTAADQAMYTAKRQGKNQAVVRSLLTEEDSQLLDEVRRHRFSAFLTARGEVSETQANTAAAFVPPSRWRIGRLARKLGWLTPEALRDVLREQRTTRKPFGEIAVARQHLTPAQVCLLLAMQQEWPPDLAKRLIELGALTETEAREALDDYHGLACAAIET